MSALIRISALAFMGFCVIVFLIGMRTQKLTREIAPSSMTYYLPNQYLEVLRDPSTGFRLIQFKMESSIQEKKEPTDLNPQPVLYVPGHYGSANQASPMASFIHNNAQMFHFFSLDFDSNQNQALHAADLYMKGAFLNEAIEKILSIYRETYKAQKRKYHLNLSILSPVSSLFVCCILLSFSFSCSFIRPKPFSLFQSSFLQTLTLFLLDTLTVASSLV